MEYNSKYTGAEIDAILSKAESQTRFMPRGAYNNETAYKRLDVVEYEGSSYLFLKDSTGVVPVGDGEVTMLLAKKGKDFAYDDFTPEQLEVLKGEKGDQGEPGKGFTILGYYGTLDLLKATVPTPEPGDTYGIGTAAPYDIYVFDGITNDWVNNGMLSGGGGEGGGNVVLIPVEVLGLSNLSTSEEILTAWGGKESFISICKRMGDRNSIVKSYVEEEQTSIIFIYNGSHYSDDSNAAIGLILSTGSSSQMLYTRLINGIALFESTITEHVERILLSNSIFDLTSESSSERILNALGGIDRINYIYDRIGNAAELNTILITDNRKPGNGYSVLHNFDGSYIDPLQNKGFNRQIYFCCTSIEPAAEIIRWVIKFNDTSAACEVTKKKVVDSSNLISDPSVGGTDKPASAEAVKVVNDKIGWTPDPDSTAEQICTGEFFTDFTGTKKQVYYKSCRVSGKFSAMADGYYSWNASIIPASYTALSATGLAEILGANSVRTPIMIGVNGYPMINSTAYINSGWLSVISKPSFQINTEIVCNAVCNIKYIKP